MMGPVMTPPSPPRSDASSQEDPQTLGSPGVLVVGGGISGAGIALDLAARGIQVTLVERGDWAGATSSASSRLVHGGLRYLEQLELSLVREACLERALLLKNAAGLVWPEEFHFPVFHDSRVGRPKLMAGLWLYTLLSIPRTLGLPHLRSAGYVRRALPGVREAGLAGGGSYLDAATDDARLTLAVVRTARRLGATCLARCELLAAEDHGSGVRARLLDHETGEAFETDAEALVLAGGPDTDALRARIEGGDTAGGKAWTEPSRGSHVIVPRERLPTDGAAIFTSEVDGRVMFLLPWPRHTVIGTTDLDHDPSVAPRATGSEVRYLLDSANALVPAAALGERDVISTWSGLRPLLASRTANPSERSREERIERTGSRTWTMAGGKLTGYRAAAEELGARVAQRLGTGLAARRSPTRSLPLVGALGGPVPRPAWSRLDDMGRVRDLDPRGVAWDARYGAEAAAVRRTCSAMAGGGVALDQRTLLGELDHAGLVEDCRDLCSFLFRRTDLGLLSPGVADERMEELAVRLGEHRGWDDGRRASEVAAARAELARRQAWRSD